MIVRKGPERHTSRIIRLVIGNPLIMKEMAKHVPDAGSYAPVTVLVDERPDGVHLSYDRMASLLAPYENLDALEVARNLDMKVEDLFETSCRLRDYFREENSWPTTRRLGKSARSPGFTSELLRFRRTEPSTIFCRLNWRSRYGWK